MTDPIIQRDSALRRVDIAAAIATGMPKPGPARVALFGDGVVAAALAAEDLTTDAYSLEFLADCVRSLGVNAALELPEPLIGVERTELVRGWMSAACAESGIDVARDELFARWLEAVALVLSARARAAGTDSGVHS
ncbi:hypothetical protein GV794_03440 [Nocardia cyriacigeorgica]|uniref:Uncharacterized protein n=1 Tax=Nocardia cyriacigeorgica TaxID=135487 RepID=A0ABX0CGF6_9NOCA|nr:hypothetical protein [Nocardia cyriacigeorgica]NEW54723.1 hypothetical protein [Nocardia cyriacigeorgica]